MREIFNLLAQKIVDQMNMSRFLLIHSISKARGLSALFLIAIFLLSLGCEPQSQQNMELPKVSKVATTILGYLSLPDFVNDDFKAQVLEGRADFLVYDNRRSLVYFSLEDSSMLGELTHI